MISTIKPKNIISTGDFNTSAMTNKNKQQFSPFYKVKKMTKSFRLGFGFPLIPTNDNYDHFKFDLRVEFLRYVAFWITSVCVGLYGFYIFYKCTKIMYPILSVHTVLTGSGLSNLDIAALMLISPIHQISNLIYVFSFKNGVTGLNKIIHNLSVMNEKFYKILIGMESIQMKTKISQFYLNLRYLISFILAVIASVILTYSWESIMLENYGDILPLWEKVIFCVILTVMNLSYIYPPMAKSSDFVIGYLIDETKDVFGYFKSVLRPDKMMEEDKNQGLNHIDKDKKKSRYSK